MQIILIAAGTLCILYFLCIAFFIGHGTNFYYIWLFAGILCFIIGYLVKKKLFLQILPGWSIKILLALLSLGVVIFILVEGCIVGGFGAKGIESLDYIIVLGAQIKESGPSKVLQMRLDKAYEYASQNENTKVIVSGGQGKDEPISEAQGMYEYLVKKGLSPERIIQENKSQNTFQNLEFSSEYINKESDSVGIVTNNFHIFRAVRIAKKSGYEDVYGIAARSEPAMQANNMLREFFGVTKDFLMGNL